MKIIMAFISAERFHDVVITYIPSERFYLSVFWSSVVLLTRFNLVFNFYGMKKGNTDLKWVKEPLVSRFKVLRNVYCVWNILEL